MLCLLGGNNPIKCLIQRCLTCFFFFFFLLLRVYTWHFIHIVSFNPSPQNSVTYVLLSLFFSEVGKDLESL